MTDLPEKSINKLVEDIGTYKRSYYIVNPPVKVRNRIQEKLTNREIKLEKISSLKELRKFKKSLPEKFTVVFVEKTNEIIEQGKSGYVFDGLNGNISFLFFLKGEIKSEYYNQWFEYCSKNRINSFDWGKKLFQPSTQKKEFSFKSFKKALSIILLFMLYSFFIFAIFILAYLPFKTVFPSIIPDLGPSILKWEAMSFLKIIFYFLLVAAISMKILCMIKKVPYNYYYKKISDRLKENIHRQKGKNI